MRKIVVWMSAVALVGALMPVSVMAQTGDVSINEVRIDQPSTDNDEYFELAGPSGHTLDGLTYLVIGDGAGGSGVIEAVVDLTGASIGTSGFFVAAESTFSLGTADATVNLNFENGDNVTHLLVDGFTGANGDDLDTDDDGTLDSSPWSTIVDSVALIQSTSSGDLVYSANQVGPDGSFVPGHVFLCDDGWRIGSFDPVGGDDTPGAANFCPEPEPTDVKIHDIQGPGFSSPLDGDLVRIEGVVVGDFQGNSFAGDQLGGFHVQEEPADQDGDTSTSEGIFVFAPSAIDVNVGDIVEVVGTVDEFFGLTEITDVSSVAIVGSDSSAVIATPVSLPVTGDADWEEVEGMLVEFDQDLYISEFFNFDRFGEIVLTDARQYQGTHVALPGTAANMVTAANALARITLDDGRSSSNPDPAIHPNGAEFTLTNTFRGGDILQDVVGVVDYSFGSYKIQPTAGATYINANPRPSAPDPISGDVRVATFNVLNFFTHLDDGSDNCGPTANLECRGADDQEEFDRQLAKLVAGIIALDADIVGIQEIENDIRTNDGDRAHDPVLTLVEALNEADRGGTWAWVGEASHYNDYPVRNDIIYRKKVVSPVGDPVALADDAFDQKRPGDIEPVGRPPLAQTFHAHARGAEVPFTVVVNHFKSKGSSCASLGDPDLGDGQANCNLTRVAQSEALLGFVAELEGTSPSGVLVIGDLNSYAMEDPVKALEAGGLTDLLEAFVGPLAYTYVFDGQLGYLDYAMATGTMMERVVGVTSFHINADEPDILDYDTSFKKDAQDALYEPLPYRVSDHDPVIVGLDFGSKSRR